MTTEPESTDPVRPDRDDEDQTSPPAAQEGEVASPADPASEPADATAAPEAGAGADADTGGGDAAASEDAEPADERIELDLPVFHGPLDLLLHLIERSELDITEVSLLEVTDQYLSALRSREQIDLGAMADFISVAARLLLLKSRALLPRDPDEAPAEDEDEGSDARALIEALREYRRFKHAAEFLREREVGHGTYRREVPPPAVPLPTGLDTVTLSSLVDVIREVLDRMPEEEPAAEIRRDPVRLRDRMRSLVDRLQSTGRVSFKELIQSATSRTMVIVDFMAVLELIKQRYLAARQSDAFGDIELVRLEGARPPEFTHSEEDFTGV
ncbi:MAG: ScpA family protein [Dehalococcoidia bacterium]